MTSCELDYRLPTGDSEGRRTFMEGERMYSEGGRSYSEGDRIYSEGGLAYSEGNLAYSEGGMASDQRQDDSSDSDEEDKLQIVEHHQVRPGLLRSLSMGGEQGTLLSAETLELLSRRDARQQHSSGSSLDSQGDLVDDMGADMLGDMRDTLTGRNMASDAVESLLLLGQGPVFCLDKSKMDGLANSLPGNLPKFSNPMEQRMMVNYYQKMRERNNEASKRCRLKRRIKQDSLEKTKSLLESHREALGHRVAKLHKIKQILNDACRGIGKDDRSCECRDFCSLIKSANREMPDLLDLNNSRLIKKSKLARETNMEEIMEEQAAHQFNDLRPLKRGPRKQQDEKIDISETPSDMMLGQPSDMMLGVESLGIPASPVAALDLSTAGSSRLPGGLNLIKLSPNPTFTRLDLKTELAPPPDRKLSPVTFLTKTLVPLAPKNSVPLAPRSPSTPGILSGLPITIPARKIIVDNPNAILSCPLISAPTSVSTISLGPSNTISLGPSNTIILTPLTAPFRRMSSSTSPTVTKTDIRIKAEPDINIFEVDTEVKTETVAIKIEAKEEDEVGEKEKDPTITCCASLGEGEENFCSKDLIDLNTLTQPRDLVTMEPKTAGELTAAEKYIIKSRLSMEFWKADESASFICSAHRSKIVRDSNLQACSVCLKKRSKKLEMYFITYRMAVEFYMTNGRFLSIGGLACSNCKLKTLKGLDFGNSYIFPECGGHPLEDQQLIRQVKVDPDEGEGGRGGRGGVKREGEGERGVKREGEGERGDPKRRMVASPLHREVVLPPSHGNQGKMAAIQPLPPRPQVAKVSSQQVTVVAKQPPPPPLSVPPQPSSEVMLARQKYQRLNEAIVAFNPEYKPLGFTINSGKLSTCSPVVLADTIRATQEAVTTILSTIAPGQESSLWQFIRPEVDSKYKEQTGHQESDVTAGSSRS